MIKKEFIVIISIIIPLIIISWIFWPVKYSIEIFDENERPRIANVTIIKKDKIKFNETRHIAEIKLWRGNYNVLIGAEGFEIEEFEVKIPIGFRKNFTINQKIILKPRFIDLGQFTFLDPTTTLKRSPQILASGNNILFESVKKVYQANEKIMYGSYNLEISDEYFESDAVLSGEKLLKGSEEVRELILKPNEKFIILDQEEVGYIRNFLTDYIKLSDNGVIDNANKGFPKQFYLYDKDEVISLGKMLFLECLIETYEDQEIDKIFFIHKNQFFNQIGNSKDVNDCYVSGLAGTLPSDIDNNKFSDFIYVLLVESDEDSNFKFPDLNHEKREAPVSFTYDVESGRYVPAKGDGALSPCHNEDYSLGLEEDELICDEPEFVAWTTPRDDNIVTYTEYPYPVVSGILGYEEILSYSELYGIPTTNFMVKKDILAFNEVKPDLIERTKTLEKKGLIEIGSHTRYHSHMGMIEEERAFKEMKESKKFLEEFFNTEVIGFRAPYLSVAGSFENHARLLADAGYEYFSQYHDNIKMGIVGNENIKHKAATDFYTSYIGTDHFAARLLESEFLITGDHPWNIVYREGDVLMENPEGVDITRANILAMISNGGIPKLAKDLMS